MRSRHRLMSVASCPSATKGKVTLLLVLDSSETALTSVRCHNPSAASPLSGIVNFGCSSERMTYGDFQQISFGRNAEAEPAFCLFAAGSIPEHPTHSLGAVEHCRQIAAPIRHHPAAVQRSSHSAGSWGGGSLRERDLCTHG